MEGLNGILPGEKTAVDQECADGAAADNTLPGCPDHANYDSNSTDDSAPRPEIIHIVPPQEQGCPDQCSGDGTSTEATPSQDLRLVLPIPPEGHTYAGDRPQTGDSAFSFVSAEHSLYSCRDSLTSARESVSSMDSQRLEASDLAPIVQFSAFIYYCSEEEPYMRLDVLRIGKLSQRSEVSFRTVAGTAQPDEVYVHTEGHVVFEAGQNTYEIQVPLRRNGKWNPTLEFMVELTEEGKVNATLGRYLWQARIKVIDIDVFPTNRYKDAITATDMESVPKFRLLVEYFKMNFDDPVVKGGTISAMWVDQLHNLYFILKLFVTVYLVDYVLNLQSSEDRLFILKDRPASLVLIMFCLLVPYAVLHLLEYKQLSNGVDSATRATLQINLLRKFLNYDEKARANLNAEDLIMGMTRDSVDLAHKGYMNILSLAQALGKLFMILLFQLTSPAVFGMKLRFITFLPMCLSPVILGTFSLFRRARTTKYLDQQHRRLDQMVGHVNETVTNYRLIADYNRRPVFVDKYGETIDAYNDAFTEAEQVVFNNTHAAPWLTLLFVALYTLMGGMQVINNGDVSLGLFLTDLSVFEQIGSAYGRIYETFMQMQMAFPALIRITRFMNMPIDVPARMRLNRHRREVTAQLRQALRQECDVGIPLDKLPIKVDNLNFSHSERIEEERTPSPTAPAEQKTALSSAITTVTTAVRTSRRTSHCHSLPVMGKAYSMNGGTVGTSPRPSQRQINYSGKMEISQGQLVFVIGPRGEGKSTLLKIIGAVIPPEVKGNEIVFIPSHLRVLHIWTEAMFFRGTLLENLVFGVSPGDQDSRMERVVAICRRLSLPADVLALIESDRVLDWGHVLSQTQRCLLSLARALVANPEVLCVHKPTLPFDENTSLRVVKLLKEFVLLKGLEQDPDSYLLRRPRTCILSSSKMVGVDQADLVFHVCSSHGIRQIEKHLVHLMTID